MIEAYRLAFQGPTGYILIKLGQKHNSVGGNYKKREENQNAKAMMEM